MNKPRIVAAQTDFSAGVRRDVPLVDIPRNGMKSCINMLPNVGGVPLKRRAEWIHYSTAIILASYVQAGIQAPFASGDQMIVVDSQPHVQKISVSNTDLATLAGTMYQNPVFFKDSVIIPDGVDAKAVTSDGVVSSIGTTFKYAVPHKDRIVYMNGTAHTNQAAVSDANSTNVTPGNEYNFDRFLTGGASIHSGVMVFTDSSTYILRGTTPGVDGDISQEFLFPTGCADAFSIARWGEYVIWADRRGAYMSDGSTFIDLTKEGGIKSVWNSIPGNRLAGGIVGDRYVITLSSTVTGIVSETWVCHIPTRSWVSFQNYPFRCYFSSSSTSTLGQVLYAGNMSEGYVSYPGDLVTPVNPTGYDGDTVPIVWSVVTGYFRPSLTDVRWRNAYVKYAMRGTSGTATVGLQTTLSDAANIVQTQTLPLTAGSLSSPGEGYARVRVPVKHEGPAIMVSVSSSGSSGMHEADLFGIDLEYWPLDGHRT